MSNGFRSAVERIFHEHHTTVDIVSKGAMQASLICETSNLAEIINNLEKLGSVRVENDLAVICCVGVAADGVLETHPSVHWEHISSVSSIAFVPSDSVATLVSALHDQIIGNSSIDVA
jgi:hypothetical protein